MGLLLSLSALLLLLASASAKSSTTTFIGQLLLPPNSSPYPNAALTLNSGEHNAISDVDGRFSFFNLPPGIYQLDVLATLHAFPNVRIMIESDSDGSPSPPKCNLYLYTGAEKQSVSCGDAEGLTLPALAAYGYFEVRPPFSIMGLFKNPMLLMMLFSGGMMWYMPKMMEGMDPEQKAQLEKQMAMQSDPQVSCLCVCVLYLGEEGEPSESDSIIIRTLGNAWRVAKMSSWF
ncbi:hypothetical protein TL16_g09394 [Triparma laevis f. inornata]|uniref:ER membrane protein complex subunit 7 beta-sandwich domain-containing protein n=1 Tax=Triparma laevis f. inornata TaxID=1714386 RepID=A0A9W7BAH1_9STRA|nr:hypothetical protein TL16_g09394 [Triparma laevis f. inornata]